MGAHGGEMDAAPPHRLYLPAYYIDRYEVTVADYRVCVERGACSEPYAGPLAYRLDFEARYTNWDKPDRDHYPVNAVTWYQAETYCGWAGKRLPTEAEWEKAARGTDQRRYPWGDEAPDKGPECTRAIMMWAGLGFGCGHDGSAPTGTLPEGASPYGAMDMVGNVWEWVADWYDPDYYAQSPDTMPHNAEASGYRALRGNSWYYVDPIPDLRAANRFRFKPLRWVPYVGARCARAVAGGSEPQAPMLLVPRERWAVGFNDWRDRNRMVRRRLVQLMAIGEAPLRHAEVLHRAAVGDDPGSFRLLRGLRLDLLLNLRDGANVGIEIPAIETVQHRRAAVGEVDMGVGEPRQHRAALEIDHLGLGAAQILHVPGVADRDDAPIPHRDGLGHAVVFVRRDDPSTGENQVGCQFCLRHVTSSPSARRRRKPAAASVEAARHVAENGDDLVDLPGLDDQRRRHRDHVAGLAHQQAGLEAAHEAVVGACARRACARCELDRTQ